jgi:hypothetical protein
MLGLVLVVENHIQRVISPREVPQRNETVDVVKPQLLHRTAFARNVGEFMLPVTVGKGRILSNA